MITYFDSAIDDAKRHAMAEYPNESCGFVVNGEYYPVDNKHPEPSNNFRIHSSTYRKFDSMGIEALIHSHNQQPHASEYDLQQQIAMNVPWGIINMNKYGNVADVFFWGDMLPKQDLIGRPFYSGVYDCYTLARDYYIVEHDIWLPNIAHEWDFWNNPKASRHFEEQLAILFKEGTWKLIDKKDIKPYDGILMKCDKHRIINHCGIYLGNGLLLHHLYRKLSRREPINRWMDSVVLAIRNIKYA